jgi:hypothetical protein
MTPTTVATTSSVSATATLSRIFLPFMFLPSQESTRRAFTFVVSPERRGTQRCSAPIEGGS